MSQPIQPSGDVNVNGNAMYSNMQYSQGMEKLCNLYFISQVGKSSIKNM